MDKERIFFILNTVAVTTASRNLKYTVSKITTNYFRLL